MYPDQKLRRRKKSGEERRRHFPSDTRQENRGKICPAAPSPPAHSLALAHSPQPDIVGPAALQFWAAVAGARRCRGFRTKGVLLYFVQLASSGIGRPRIRWCGLGYASDDWLRTAGSWAAVDGRDWQGLAGGGTAWHRVVRPLTRPLWGGTRRRCAGANGDLRRGMPRNNETKRPLYKRNKRGISD